MASISGTTSLDVNSLVSQLVAAERAPAESRLATAQSKASTRISALGSLKSSLANLQTAAKTLTNGGGALVTPKSSSSNAEIVTATASAGAPRGNYAVEVVALAQSSKLVSGSFAAPTTALGSGSVQITMGDKSFTVTLGNDANTLADLRTAINNATDNPGVTASLVTEAGGTRLLLTGDETGASKAVSLSSSLLSMTQTQAASDAHVRVEGYDVYSGTNTVTGALEGVTLNLLKAEEGTTVNLSLSADNSAATKAVQDFIAKFNASVSTINVLTKYDPAAKQAATLTGDAAARDAMQQLRSVVGGVATGSGSYSYLSQVGIKTAADGTLTVDSAKLGEALAKDPGSVAKLFGGAGGYATKLESVLGTLVGDSSPIAAEVDGYKKRLDDIGKQQDALDRRMTQVQARYLAQFTALDRMMTTMQSTSGFLTQQLASLPGSGSS